jgi:hypothetical protein
MMEGSHIRARMSLRFQQILTSRKTFVSLRDNPDVVALAIIGAFLACRLGIAAALGFAVDESYAVASARDLSLSYFDHPPLHYWIAHVFMPLLGDGHALRLPFIFLFAGSTWLLYRLTCRLFSAWAGVWAALAFNVSFFFTVSAGGWIVPDGPLIFCLLAAALTLANGFFPAAAAPSPWRTWIPAGIWLGLAGLSKYHAVLFALSLLLYLLSVPERRRVLLHPAPWAGAFIALAMFTPVLIWNAKHDWVSFIFQSGRGFVYLSQDAAQSVLHVGNVLANAAGQAVWISPWIVVPLVLATWQALRAGRRHEQSWYCLCLGLPTILFFTIIPLWGRQGLPHWPMSGWLMLYPLLGDYLERAASRQWPRRWAISSAVLFAALALIIVGHAATGFGKLVVPEAFRRGDPTLEAFEWTPLRRELAARNYLERNDLFVVAPNWIDAGRIDQALGGALPVVAFADARNFASRDDQRSFVGWDALIIGVKIEPYVEKRLRPFFDSIEELPSFSFGRAGMQEIKLRIFLARKLLMPFPPFYAPDATARNGRG